MLQILMNNRVIPVEAILFSDGAKTFNIDWEQIESDGELKVVISVDPKTPVCEVRDEVDLILSFLSIFIIDKLVLYMPYLPYARGDRRFETGNPFPLDMFLSWLEACEFDEVFVEDPHNIDALANYDITWNIAYQHNLAYNSFVGSGATHILAPDTGAIEKAKNLARLNKTPLLYGFKTRNKHTGKIEEIGLKTIPERGSTVFIADDILDGGGTFIPLAKLLKDLDCKVILYVTHLIASRGLGIFSDLIDEINYINIINPNLSREDVINFNNQYYFKETK